MASDSAHPEGILFVQQDISIQEAISILENPPLQKAISSPPSKPKGSQAFLYVAKSPAKEGM